MMTKYAALLCLYYHEVVEVFGKRTLSEWKQIYEWVKNERKKK